jgi:transposase-like protein
MMNHLGEATNSTKTRMNFSGLPIIYQAPSKAASKNKSTQNQNIISLTSLTSINYSARQALNQMNRFRRTASACWPT